MSEEIQEFVAGDKFTVTTTLEHGANIAGITVSYHSENEPHASYGALVLSKGRIDVGRSPHDQSVSLPGPYLSGEITLERVMNLGGNRIEMRVPRSDWFPRDLRFPHS